jgi:hypothetical protein
VVLSALQPRDFPSGQPFGVVDLAVFPFLKYGVPVSDEDDSMAYRTLVEHLPREVWFTGLSGTEDTR